MSSENYVRYGVNAFIENDWTRFAREHKVDINMKPVIHRSPHLGPRIGGRPMLKRRTELYKKGNTWSEFIKKQEENKP